MHYLYQIYIHLRYDNKPLLLPCMQQVLQLLVNHREVLIRFFKVNKRYFSSEIEKKIVLILDQKVAAKDTNNTSFVVEIKVRRTNPPSSYLTSPSLFQHDVPLIFYDDLRELENNPNFPEKELAIPYTMDSRKGALCFEVNGGSHYLTDVAGRETLDGINLLKKDFLERTGFKYIEIKNSLLN